MANYISIMEDMMELQEILILDNFAWDMAEVNDELAHYYESSLCANF